MRQSSRCRCIRIWIELRRDWLVSVLALMIRSDQSNSFHWISGTITELKQCEAQLSNSACGPGAEYLMSGPESAARHVSWRTLLAAMSARLNCNPSCTRLHPILRGVVGLVSA